MAAGTIAQRAVQWVAGVVLWAMLACACKSAPVDNQGAPDAIAVEGTEVRVGEPVNQLPMPREVVVATVNPSNLPVYEGPTGSVEGVVSMRGEPPLAVKNINFHKCPAAADTRGTIFRQGVRLEDGSAALPGAVIAVTGYAGYFIPEQKPSREVVLNDCAEMPPTIDLTFGQRLDVFNRTKLLFAPVLEQFMTTTVMVATPRGDPVKLYARKPGHFRMLDRMGSDFLSADVYVLYHPLHATSDRGGRYRIDGIPLGKLKIGAHLVATGEDVVHEFEVASGSVSRVDFAFTYTSIKADASSKSSGGSSSPISP